MYNGTNYSVIYIGSQAFYNCRGLTAITIPNSITHISFYAFYQCTDLTSITIPNSVIYIGNGAFCGCTGLTSITIPNSVTGIDENAFRNCTGLTSITIPNSVTYINEGAFSNCTGLSSITIPEDLDVSKADLCFEQDNICYKVLNNKEVEITGNYRGSIVIPSSVTNNGNNYSVTSIGRISGLTSITIPNYITHIGDFSGCKFTSVTINSDVDVSNSAIYITTDSLRYRVLDRNSVEVAFNGERGQNECDYDYYSSYVFDDLKIPVSITAGGTYSVVGIGPHAFRGCEELKSITIPNSITSISVDAFGDVI